MARVSDADVKVVGKEIFDRMKGQTPSVFNKDWWSGKVMDISMKDEAFKVEMFRFVDVFPTLRSHVEVAQHLQEYFCRPDTDFPAAFQWGLNKVKPDSMVAKIAASQIEKQMTGMASKFIAGTTAADAIDSLRKIWKSNLAFTLDLLGEATVSEDEARAYALRYDEILDTLIRETAGWKENPQLEKASWGRVPRVNVSVKVSSLYSQIDPIDFDGSISQMKDRLRPLFRKAMQNGAFVNLDMEQYAFKDLTIALFKSLLDEPEFQKFDGAGIAIQAYLRDAVDDVTKLSAWAKTRGTPVTVRLIKGAYWDFETIHSEQEAWRNPVWSKKWETDACFERCTEVLLDNHPHIRLAVGSHNVRSIAHAIVYAKSLNIDATALEFQMLYGMAEPMKLALAQMGYRVREYAPIGEMIPGMAYLVRRLLENTSNESWLRHSYADGYSIDQLLAAPAAPAGQSESTGIEHIKPLTPMGFRNAPLLNFALANNRESFARAMAEAPKLFDKTWPIVINGKEITSDRKITSHNPSRTEQVVGSVYAANTEHAQKAVEAARAAFSSWSRRPAEERASLLMKLAEIMMKKRNDLSAVIVHEVGKNWREADADVCEAIDFCRYYALEMMRLDAPQRLGNVAGEMNTMFYQPRGVAAVIAPWNFPIAILTGMTVAALVTGNTVIMKPAEQSSVIAAHLMAMCREAGFPDGVVNFLPGYGEEVGAFLVEHDHVDLIAFTGSMQVGLGILKSAGNTHAGQMGVKKVICEMGGKNAIIVDGDADLDEAVHGVVASAFGFQGQKCSACSRVIVLASAYDEFKERLVGAVKSLEIGLATDPAFGIGPVIDEEAQKKCQSYIELGKTEGTLLVSRDVPAGGTFVGPTIFENIAPTARLAQEEIFGPVLALMKAKDFDEALDIANSTRYALTGGIYSRSPLNLDKVRREFRVGNLYINRKCTGALVFRQPFGGFKMSGVGAKAGGPDYLLQFLEPRAISENTMRRGFAPAE
ncbi:MAG: L-glutamate gamma-semialdehyde dehydrogenase [bacterium]